MPCGGVGPTELILILAIILIVFGIGKLPEVGKGLGKGIKEFREAYKTEEIEAAKTEEKKQEDKKAEEKKPESEPEKKDQA